MRPGVLREPGPRPQRLSLPAQRARPPSARRVNFPRFVDEFRAAVDSSFESVYAVGRRFSKVTADQFDGSMRRVGAPIRPAPKAIQALFDPTYVEAAFTTREYAFDATLLCGLMAERVRRAGVDVRLGPPSGPSGRRPGSAVRVETDGPDGPAAVAAGHVFGCGYAQTERPRGGRRPAAGAAQARTGGDGPGGGPGPAPRPRRDRHGRAVFLPDALPRPPIAHAEPRPLHAARPLVRRRPARSGRRTTASTGLRSRPPSRTWSGTPPATCRRPGRVRATASRFGR